MHADLQQIMLCVIGRLLDINAKGFSSRTEWIYIAQNRAQHWALEYIIVAVCKRR